MNESCHTYEWVMSHIQTSHVTHMNESCHTYEWVMSHIWMSHVTHMKESFTHVTWLIRMCDVTDSHAWQDAFTCLTCLHTYDMTRNLSATHQYLSATHQYLSGTQRILSTSRHTSANIVRINMVIYVYANTYIHIFIYMYIYIATAAAWPSFTCVTCLIHMCDVTHSHVWYDSSHTSAPKSDVCEWVMSHISILCHKYEWVMSQNLHESYHTHEWDTSAPASGFCAPLFGGSRLAAAAAWPANNCETLRYSRGKRPQCNRGI